MESRVLRVIIALSVSLFTHVKYANAQCLYCHRMDMNGGFLKSYSYCNHTDECLEDAWNYLNKECESGWVRGKELNFDTCMAV